MRHTDVAHSKPVLALNLAMPAAHSHGPRAVVLLHLLGFGVAMQGINTSGQRVAWFAKWPHGHDNLRTARQLLNLAEADATPSKLSPDNRGARGGRSRIQSLELLRPWFPSLGFTREARSKYTLYMLAPLAQQHRS